MDIPVSNAYPASFRLSKAVGQLYGLPNDMYLLENFNIYTGNDLNEAAQQVGRFAEKRVFKELNPKDAHFNKINRARLKHSQITLNYGTGSSELSFSRPVNHHNLIIPLKGNRIYVSDSEEIRFSPGQALMISYDQKYTLKRGRNHLTLVCSLSRSGYELFAHKSAMVSLFLSGSFTSLLDMNDAKYLTAIRVLSALINEIDKKNQNNIQDDEIVGLLEQSFWTALINALPEFQYDERMTLSGRAVPGYLSKTIHYINEHCEEDLKLSDLAHVAGKSKRLLQSGFQKTFGYGPTLYLRKVKLMRVKEQILKQPGDDIQMIAARYGFYHAGNFARYYRQEFDELPSETLKN